MSIAIINSYCPLKGKEVAMSQGYPYPGAGPAKPGMVQAIAIMTLVNGILNILWALGATAAIVLGTFGIGLLCAPLTIAPLILGIFEIIYAEKLLANPPKPTQPSQLIAILEIACILAGNGVSLVIGILALVFYNQPEVQAFFAQLNAPEAR
jgi:hypothetical protein